MMFAIPCHQPPTHSLLTDAFGMFGTERERVCDWWKNSIKKYNSNEKSSLRQERQRNKKKWEKYALSKSLLRRIFHLTSVFHSLSTDFRMFEIFAQMSWRWGVGGPAFKSCELGGGGQDEREMIYSQYNLITRTMRASDVLFKPGVCWGVIFCSLSTRMLKKSNIIVSHALFNPLTRCCWIVA